MHDQDYEAAKKLIAAKLLLDTYEIPKRPIALSAHQFKKKFGSNQGYAAYKKAIKQERLEWDILYKDDQKNFRRKLKVLSGVKLTDEALLQAEALASNSEQSLEEIISAWIEKGRQI